MTCASTPWHGELHRGRASKGDPRRLCSPLERVAAAAGVQLSLGKAGSQGNTYLKMMRYNVLTIVQALKR